MSDISNASEVTITKAGSVETFYLKCENVEVSVSNNLIARAILSAAGDIAGSDPVLNSVTYQLTGIYIQAIEDEDYPDSPIDNAPSNYYSGVDSNDHNQRMMIALKEASKQWGPESDGDIDQLSWDGQTIPIVITSFSASEGATSPKPGVYQADMELTHISAYVG